MQDATFWWFPLLQYKIQAAKYDRVCDQHSELRTQAEEELFPCQNIGESFDADQPDNSAVVSLRAANH
ncbi:putative protein OS=Eoetvoesiella caeni OX=645616 GN=DFR37_1165 PE=4 SV=1 [Eoetvoesiella caeni]|uniref:Uncharacterized protein n=1 Tax=Eoetvoesiella caeni TaxID=645616 RepID=A0A366H1C3_9BURK|nr:hypothetical protein DFR37_1165 [Eoetvoesiella caeni]